MNATTMEDEWFARNMPGNIRTAEPAANDAVPQFPLDALYPQQHNNTNNRTFDIQQLMRLNQNSPTSPALNSSSDSPTHMLLRLLGLIPGNPAGGDLPAGLPGVLDTAQTFKRQGLSVDNIDLSNGQLQNIQELLRNQQPNSLQLPQQSAALQVSAAEASYLQHAGHHLEMPDLGAMGRDGMGSSLQQHAVAQLQQAQHASDNHSMSNINVLSLLDPSNHSNLLGKQSNDGAQAHVGQYDAQDAYLTHRDLLAGGISSGMDRNNVWNHIPKSEPIQDNRMGAYTPDNQHGATENGSEKNMQDLLESVQRRNPMDTHGWKEVAMDVNVEPEKWPELKQCYENFRVQHPIANTPAPVRATARTDSPPIGSRRSSARPSPVDAALDRPTTTPNKHGRRINPRKGIPMHIMATYALLRLPDHEGNLSDMSAKIEENAFFCKQLDWTPRPGTKTYPRWKDALVGCFKPGRYPHLKKTSRKKEGLTVYALMDNCIPEKSCLKPSMLTDVDPASLPADFDINNPLVPLRNANSRIADKSNHDATSVVTTGIQPMGAHGMGSRGPLTGSIHSMPGMDSASLANSGLGGGRNSFNSLSMGLNRDLRGGSLAGEIKPNVDLMTNDGIEQASALIAAAMQQHQQRQ